MNAIVSFAVRRRVTIIMIALAVLAFGFVGLDRLSVDLLPDISYPSLTVQTEFPDTAPAEVENLVTRPVEEAVGVLRGLQNIHRSSAEITNVKGDWCAIRIVVNPRVVAKTAGDRTELIHKLVALNIVQQTPLLPIHQQIHPSRSAALAGIGNPILNKLAAKRLQICQLLCNPP